MSSDLVLVVKLPGFSHESCTLMTLSSSRQLLEALLWLEHFLHLVPLSGVKYQLEFGGDKPHSNHSTCKTDRRKEAGLTQLEYV